jgi:drug/metabolite transporter (DMT)-like permease
LRRRHLRRAELILLASATLWGLSWWPMQALGKVGVAGPLLCLLAYGSMGLLSLPLLMRERQQWRGRGLQMLAIALFSGWAAASFVLAMTQGDVVREMLLFYLAPAWSVLGGWWLLKEGIGRRRLLAVSIALTGACLVIRAGASMTDQPISVADGLALSAGVTFAAGNLATRAASEIPLASKTSMQLLGCALLSALIMALRGTPFVLPDAPALLGVAAFALVWIVGGTSTTAYGMSQLEAGRSALIILAELVAAVVSASLFQQRIPGGLEVFGGVLILLAAAIDASGQPPPVPAEWQ